MSIINSLDQTVVFPSRDPSRIEAERQLDRMIYDRAPGLEGSWHEPLAMPVIRAMVRYDVAAAYIQEWVNCSSGIDIIETMYEELRPEVHTVGGSDLPGAGEGCLLIANHPTGLPDALALYDFVRPSRRDVAVIVFHDLLSINPGATDALIPHDWRPAHRTLAKARETTRLTKKALDANRLVTIFPSGDIAYWNGRQLRDYPWQKAFITFARKFKQPIIPVHVRARNSMPYYFLRLVSATLRDLIVIREIQNKIGSRFDVTYGPRVEPDQLVGRCRRTDGAVPALRRGHSAQQSGRPFPRQLSHRPAVSCGGNSSVNSGAQTMGILLRVPAPEGQGRIVPVR